MHPMNLVFDEFARYPNLGAKICINAHIRLRICVQRTMRLSAKCETQNSLDSLCVISCATPGIVFRWMLTRSSIVNASRWVCSFSSMIHESAALQRARVCLHTVILQVPRIQLSEMKGPLKNDPTVRVVIHACWSIIHSTSFGSVHCNRIIFLFSQENDGSCCLAIIESSTLCICCAYRVHPYLDYRDV
jgi:hypothetical protein